MGVGLRIKASRLRAIRVLSFIYGFLGLPINKTTVSSKVKMLMIPAPRVPLFTAHGADRLLACYDLHRMLAARVSPRAAMHTFVSFTVLATLPTQLL